jgi:hypothetical protein
MGNPDFAGFTNYLLWYSWFKRKQLSRKTSHQLLRILFKTYLHKTTQSDWGVQVLFQFLVHFAIVWYNV